jgi:ribonucleoside-diphosphate reductase beta chain
MNKRLLKKLSRVFQTRDTFKPFYYPWAYQMWLKHEQVHWLAREVPLHEDVRDWNNKLTLEDQLFLRDVFLFFTQSDVDVLGGYVNDYFPYFKQPELRMMLAGFAARECVHIDAYSYLIETLGMEDNFYTEFLNVPAMRQKHEFFENVVSSARKGKTRDQLLTTITGISAGTEGLFLFSSFVMLLNYPKNNLMKGMGQIVAWSVLDEQLHVAGLTKVANTIVEENRGWKTKESDAEIRATIELMVEFEFDFIDTVYKKKTEMRGLLKEDLKQYIRWTADKRLRDLGVTPLYGVSGDPLPWVAEMIGSQSHANFFEARETSYAKASLTGSWGDVWGAFRRALPKG